MMFFYSLYRNSKEFWKVEGKHGSKVNDKFIEPSAAVGAAVQQLASASDTQDHKLNRIYAAVESIDDTNSSVSTRSSKMRLKGWRSYEAGDKGPIGSPTGKRLLIPGDLFETNTKATFAHEQRVVGLFLALL